MNLTRFKQLILFATLIAALALPAAGAQAEDTVGFRSDVIVTLAVPAGSTVAQATDALLATLPAGDYVVTNRFTALPYVSLTVGPPTLAALQGNGLVAAVENNQQVTAAAPVKKCKTVKKKAKKGKRARSVKVCSVVH